MYLVVGLGNPGRRYAATRHNVGFMVIERLVRRWQIALGPERDGLRVGHGRIAAQPVILAEPQGYMNLSGEGLAPLQQQTGAQVLVVHDDIDLPHGQLRVKRGGGTGGHRGLESIVACCGAEFDRVRVGVGRPAPREDAATHVLAPFRPEECETLEAVLDRAADAVETIIGEGLEAAMNRFNQRVPAAAPAN